MACPSAAPGRLLLPVPPLPASARRCTARRLPCPESQEASPRAVNAPCSAMVTEPQREWASDSAAVSTPPSLLSAGAPRRSVVALLPGLAAAARCLPSRAAEIEVEPIPAFTLDSLVAGEGHWVELESGILFRVLREGQGDRGKGVFDKVDHFQPFPFVTVRFTAYESSGKVFASNRSPGNRDYSYQAGVRQELQDEDGAVMSMIVGERRQFVIPFEVAYRRKLFGQPVPQREALLVDVDLLALQPY